jgi:hypothetical protein
MGNKLGLLKNSKKYTALVFHTNSESIIDENLNNLAPNIKTNYINYLISKV